MADEREFVIWSWEHAAWWRPFELGYTADLEEAGRYPYDRAAEIVENAYGNEAAIEEGLLTPTVLRVIADVQAMLSPRDRLVPIVIESAPWSRRKARESDARD